jgi:hypothetical protein
MFPAWAAHYSGIGYKQSSYHACRPEPKKTGRVGRHRKPTLKMQLSILISNLLLAGSAAAATVGGDPFDDSIRMQGKEWRLKSVLLGESDSARQYCGLGGTPNAER